MIYLDHNATTPLDPAVKNAINEAEDHFCNSSGSYGESLVSKGYLDTARMKISNLLDVRSQQVIFTSGSTEAVTLAIWNSMLNAPSNRRRVIVGSIEHKAVLETVRIASKVLGFNVDYLNSDSSGQYVIEELKNLLNGDDVALVCCMFANNETGVIQQIEEISQLTKHYGIELLCDTTQIFGRVDKSYVLKELDYYCMSAHKFYGPKGVGALVINSGSIRTFKSVIPGGGQEFGVRGGTSNVPGIWGLATASELFAIPSQNRFFNAKRQIDMLVEGAKAIHPTTKINGDVHTKLPNTVNLMFKGLVADEILVSLKEVQASKASACTAGVDEPSHVLLGMGLSYEDAEASIRFSTGKSTTDEDIRRALLDLSEAISRVRSFNGSN